MTHDEMLAALAPPRLPADMASISASEMLALLGLGLLVGLLLAMLLRPLLTHQPSVRARIRATRGQAPQDRLLSVARILGHLPAALRPAAYGAAPPPAPDQVERLALSHRKARK